MADINNIQNLQELKDVIADYLKSPKTPPLRGSELNIILSKVLEFAPGTSVSNKSVVYGFLDANGQISIEDYSIISNDVPEPMFEFWSIDEEAGVIKETLLQGVGVIKYRTQGVITKVDFDGLFGTGFIRILPVADVLIPPTLALSVTNNTSSAVDINGMVIGAGTSTEINLPENSQASVYRQDEEPYKENSAARIFTKDDPLSILMDGVKSAVLQNIYGNDFNCPISFDFWQDGGETEGFTVSWDYRDSIGQVFVFSQVYDPYGNPQYGGGFYAVDKLNWVIDIEFPSETNVATRLDHIYRDSQQVINQYPLADLGNNKYRATVPLKEVHESMTFMIRAEYNPNN